MIKHGKNYKICFLASYTVIFALMGQILFPFEVSASEIIKNNLPGFINTRSVQAVQLSESGFSAVGVNVARTQSVTASSFAVPVLVNTGARMLNILNSVSSVVQLAPGNGLKLLLTNYNDASTDLLVISSSTFPGYISGDNPAAFIETTYDGETAWLMWIGNHNSGSLNTNVYRSINNGATWNRVQNLPNVAPPPDSQSIAINNGTVVWGEYVDGPSFSHPRFYMSEDGGTSWNNDTPIYQENDYLSHTHQLSFKPNDPTKIYAIFGDNSSWAERIDLNSSTGQWEKTKDNHGLGLFIDSMVPFANGKILTTGFGGVGSVDESTWQETPKVFFPMPWRSDVKYQYQQPSGTGTSIRRLALDESNGILYGAMNSYSTPPNSNLSQGIYISADYGDTWTSIYRTPTNWGFRWASFLNDRVYLESEGGIYRMNKIKASTVNSLRLDNNIPNTITLRQNTTFIDSSGNSSIGNWANYSGSLGPATLEVASGGIDDSGYNLHMVTGGPSVDGASGRNLIKLGPLSSVLTSPPANGSQSYYLMKFWARSPNYASNYNPIRAYLFGSAGIFTTLYVRPTDTWQEFIVAGQLSASDLNASLNFMVRADKTSGTNQVFDVYFDDFQLYFSNTPLDPKTWNILPNLPNVNESYYTDYNINSDNWSLGFDWIGPAYDEYGGGTLLTVKDIPESHYLKINWNAASQKYELTDGITTVSTIVTYKRLHFDLTRFYLVSNGTDALLYIIDPVNGTQVIGSGAHFSLSNIGRAYYGVAADSSSNYMPGNYFNTKGWNVSLTSAEIANDLLNAGSGILYNDAAAPSNGSITYLNGSNTNKVVALSVNDGSDSDSGINTSTRTLQRRSAVLSEGNCGAFDSFVTINLTGTYPNFTDVTVSFDNCYQYQYLVSDIVSNQAIYSSSNIVKVSTTASNVSGSNSGGASFYTIPNSTTNTTTSTVVLPDKSSPDDKVATPSTLLKNPAVGSDLEKMTSSSAFILVKINNIGFFKKNLWIGVNGLAVKELQIALKNLGYFKFSSITGYFGPITVQAVRKFQRKYNIKPVSGIVGPKTRKVLNEIFVVQ
ncbi:MAG: Large repetitive protein [Candidatus Magasanikbacteria bacterium GW2011_GWC2_41_17]|uniref:Large repetitive protein n=2 Tax=Candidatus Magasanikiibacteriota TaxID=1752731 RepID=A0A0G1A605_9BACT|nr:MAG: Large repetitive protein [Candidatus Magasanikbacteria bacterium GW2011_GWC2_41_17]KKS56502.1 MAG: Large repetitive protein [Candidatus Magasanikbacteria bacterium GW2011_GWA2_42_32]HBX15765.1 hypothetical protein [Candidatus Magasanikbacteria bacterium]